jgi:hypothetical protein
MNGGRSMLRERSLMLVLLLLQRVLQLSAPNHSNHVCNQTELEYVMQMLAPSPELLELIHDSDLGWTDSLSQLLGN